MEKLKNGCHFFNIDCMEKFQITDLPKVWVSSFPSVNGNEISMSAIMEKLKKGCHFFKIDHTEKFQITNPSKVWVSGFLSVDGNGISMLAIMEKLKNGCHFFNIDCTEKFQITDPPKFGSPVFFSSENWRCKFSFFSEFSIDSFSPITHPRFHFNIYAWLHLKHLCVDISGLPLQSPMCSSTLPDICILSPFNPFEL